MRRVCVFLTDGELNVLEDILTDAPDQDDELYNPESEHDVNEKKGTCAGHRLKALTWSDSDSSHL